MFDVFLILNVIADLFDIKPDGGYSIPACPEMFSRKVLLLSSKLPCNSNRAFSLQKSELKKENSC